MDHQLSEFEQEQMREIERRVDYLEKNVDMNTNNFGRGNWIAVAFTAVASLALLIWGFFV